MPTRRDFIAMGAAAALAPGASAAERKFTIAFTPGSIGVKTDQEGAVTLASQYGFVQETEIKRRVVADEDGP